MHEGGEWESEISVDFCSGRRLNPFFSGRVRTPGFPTVEMALREEFLIA